MHFGGPETLCGKVVNFLRKEKHRGKTDLFPPMLKTEATREGGGVWHDFVFGVTKQYLKKKAAVTDGFSNPSMFHVLSL